MSSGGKRPPMSESFISQGCLVCCFCSTLFSPVMGESQYVNSQCVNWNPHLEVLILNLGTLLPRPNHLVTVTSVSAIYDATSFWNFLADVTFWHHDIIMLISDDCDCDSHLHHTSNSGHTDVS